jgi:hypothetical protein
VLEAESTQGHSAAGRIKSMENPSDTKKLCHRVPLIRHKEVFNYLSLTRTNGRESAIEGNEMTLRSGKKDMS